MTRTPVVCCVAGAPGTGKSTLGRELSVRLDAVLVDQDVATNPLMARIAELVGAGDDLDHPGLRGSVRQARYDCILDLAADNIGLGRSAVVVAPFTIEVADPAAWENVVARLRPAPVHLVWTVVPPAVARERRRRRGLPRDQAAPKALAGSAAAVDPAVEHLIADGDAPAGAEADRLAGLIG